MKKKALRKEFYMEVKTTLNRFLSILLIVALGVAFYSGIQSAAPDMRYSGDEYFDEHKLMDLKVVGTLGLTEDDVTALSQIDGIAAAEPGYMTDVLCGGETQKVVRIESICPTLNQLTAEEGRLPEKSGECFVDLEFLDKAGYKVGDEIEFYLEDEDNYLLKRHTFTIVGAGSSPLYIAFSRGNTTLGNGELGGVGYVLAEDFDSEVYTQIYLEVKGARNLTAYTDAYDTLIANVMERVEAIADGRCEIRYKEVTDEANEKIADAQEELEDGRAEGESGLAEAESELEDGEKQLEDGKKDLEDAKQQIEDAKAEIEEGEKTLSDGEQEIEDNEATLAEKEQELEDGKAQLEDGWAQYYSGQSEIEKNEATLTASEKELVSGEKQLAAAKEQLASGKKEYEEGLAQYNEGLAEYEAGEKEYASGKAEYDKQKNAWPAQKESLGQQKTQLLEQQEQLESGLSQLNAKAEELNSQKDSAGAKRQELQAQLDALESQSAGLSEQVQALTGEQETLNSSVSTLNAQIENYKSQIAAEQAKETPSETKLQELTAGRDTAQTQLAQAQERLSSLAGELAAAQASLEQCQAGAEQLNAGIAEADAGISQIQSGLDTVNSQITEYSGNLEQVKAGITKIDQGIAQGDQELAEAEQTLSQSRAQLDAVKKQLEGSKAQLADAKEEIESGEQEITANEKKLEEGRKELESGQAQLAQAKETLSASRQKLLSSQATITEGEQQIAEGKQQIEDAKQELEDGRKDLEDAKKELEDAQKEVEDGEKEIEENEKKLEDGRKEYEDGVKTFQEEIADGEQKIADAKQELADLSEPEWTVTDRSDLPDNIGYGENADRMRNIGQVFPVIFFLVAALISLTTMTRMVEEERTQIGTLKALGYSKGSIAAKYMGYALAATLTGSVLGILGGEKFLPYVIVTAYKIMYQHMPNVVVPYNMKYAAIAVGAALISTLGGTFAACFRELASTPAVLMRPPAPKEGKRVFLERIPILWEHLSFTWKSTVRNLFRYKKRFFMTIFGISGCMGLMIVGYGLRDSIMDIASLQFTQLQVYDGMVILDEDATEEQKDEILRQAEADSRVEGYIVSMMQKYTALVDGKHWDLYVMVPGDVEEFEQFVTFRDRVTHETYELTDEGAILTEKIAKTLGIGAGDTITIRKDENTTVEVPVAAVTENYLSHYIYLTPDLYEQCFGEEAQYNEILYRAASDDLEEISSVGQDLLDNDAALSISYTESLMDQVSNMLTALDSVIYVLIISAGLLAFVVLYNLNNININERRRELATIKVLGFFDNEVSAYVYRENVLITIIGIFAGVGLGILLHRFIITTVEVDSCMFGRNINLSSFLIASVFTVIFSVFVNVVMFFKLKKIDMVESLKSVE